MTASCARLIDRFAFGFGFGFGFVVERRGLKGERRV
jgi:hypothetical protein